MMVELDRFMYDGADWQAKAVLAFLQAHYSIILDCTYINNFQFDAMLRADKYNHTGDREHGYLISVIYKWKKQKTIAFYEHRNVDHLCVIHRDGYIGLDTPTSEWLGKDYPMKSDRDKEFKYGEIVECGEYIKKELIDFLERCKEEEKEEKIED